MKRFVGAMLIGTALLSGCGENNPPTPVTHANVLTPAPAPADKGNTTAVQAAPALRAPAGNGTKDGLDDVVAKVSGRDITLRQLVDPLVESRGLTMLVSLVELELARQNAAKYHVVVTQKDIDDEHDRTLEKMFKESDDIKLLDALDLAVAKNDAVGEAKIRADLKLEREDYLAQFLINQHVDRVEFDIAIKTNAYLRKILDLEWKNKITDADVTNAFNQMYGEKVKVKYMELHNLNEVAVAQRRLHNGDSFEDVARDMSHDQSTAPNGGELPAFSRDAVKVPQAFKDVAFTLRDGQVSDVVAVGSAFMLIKRMGSIAPQAVRLDDWKDEKGVAHKSVRPIVQRKLYDALLEAGLKGMKKQLAIEAHTQMEIINPVMKKQVDENAERQKKAEQRAKDELDRQQRMRDAIKNGSLTRPSDTQPATGTAPATGAAPQAPEAAAGERPPATEPGTGHQFSLPRLGADTKPSVLPEANK